MFVENEIYYSAEIILFRSKKWSMLLILSAYKSEIKKINDVFRIKIDIPWSMKFVCLYLFEVAGKKVLIDAGYSPEEWKKVLYSAFTDLSGLGLP